MPPSIPGRSPFSEVDHGVLRAWKGGEEGGGWGWEGGAGCSIMYEAMWDVASGWSRECWLFVLRLGSTLN